MRCYDSETNPVASTVTVNAGDTIGFETDGTISHPGVSSKLTSSKTHRSDLTLVQVVNVYMAKAPSNVSSWDGDGAVWFKVGIIPFVCHYPSS